MASEPQPHPPGEGAAAPPGRGAPEPTGPRAAVPREALRDFLYRFIAYVKARKLYPPGHDRLRKQLESWLTATRAILEGSEEVRLFVQPGAVFVNGEEFGAGDRIASEFAPELVKRLIRYVAVQRGVEAEELAALAEPLLLEPEALRQAGGARAMLAEAGVAHLLLIEFSYDMGSYVASAEDVEVARTLARYEAGGLPEQYVLRRLGELGVGEQERRRLAQLLIQPEVAGRLSSLAEALGRFGKASRTEVHTSDLVLYVVRNLAQAEEELGGLGPREAAQAFIYLLDRLQERLLLALADREGRSRREVLTRVAQRMMSSPEELMRWLSPGSERLSVTLSPDLAELLKVIFSKAESGRRRIRFGDTVLKTLESSEEVEPEPSERTPRAEVREVRTAEVARRFNQLRAELGPTRFTLEEQAVTSAHLDVLLELLRRESQPAARERILRELAAVIGRNSAQGAPWRLAQRLLGGRVDLQEQELEILLRSPSVAVLALEEFLDGEARWEPVLRGVAARQQAGFAEALARLVLEAPEAPPLSRLQGFIDICQDGLVDWLTARFQEPEVRGRMERVVSLVLACRTIRVVPLAERLLPEVGPEARRALLHLLVRIEDARAVSALADHLLTSDRETRRDILYLLGQSSQPLAEETLLAVAARWHWLGGRLSERLTALSSLARCGGERAVPVLRRLARSWLLRLTPGGRQVRRRAAEALRAVEARLASEPALEEESGDG